jgi:hypothetical protein
MKQSRVPPRKDSGLLRYARNDEESAGAYSAPFASRFITSSS